MPRVKVYDGPDVRQQGIPDARQAMQRIEGADANAFGAIQAQQAKNMSKAVGALGDAMQQQQEIEDADQVFDKKNKFREELLSVTEQIKSRQGSNAKGVAEWADTETQKIRDKYLGELGNDRQRKIFAQDAESMRLHTRESSTSWERQQIESGLDEKWQSAKELAVAHASADPNPQNIASIEAELQRSNAFQAQRKGWDAETLQNETRKDLTKLHTGVFDVIRESGDLGAAQAYLHANGDKIDPKVKAEAIKLIRSKALDDFGTRVADQLIAEGNSYADALELVDKNYKGDDKDKILSKVRERFGDAERIKKERAEEEIEQIDKEAYQGGGMRAVSDARIERLALYNPGAAQNLRQKKEKELENLANGGDRFAKQTDYKTMDEINKLIESGDIRKPEQLDKFAGDLEKRDYEAMRKLMIGKSQIEQKDVLKAYKTRAGIKEGATLTESQASEYSSFLQGVTGYVTDTSRPQDLDVLADKFFIEKHNKDSWSIDKDLPRNAITEDAIGSEERRNQGMLNSSDPKVQAAQKILRQNGKKVTPENVIKVMQRLEQ